MTEYRIVWEIDLYADSPREAATAAHHIQQDPYSTATVFTVENRDTGDRQNIDLEVGE